MLYEVKVNVELIPGTQTFAAIGYSVVYLNDYGWKATCDSGRPGKIYEKEVRTITYSMEKNGASRADAERDVELALLGHSAGARFISIARSTISDKITSIPGVAGKAVGDAVGGTIAGVGEKTGLGSLGIIGTGAIASALILGVLGVALVFAVKRA